jgi:SpoVK/Ycf46/Vps4 family AAA+-type ATPase
MSTAAVVPEVTGAVLPDISPAVLATLMKKPEKVKASTRKAIEWPTFLSQANQEYTSGNAHVFVLHGNVNDYPDNEAHLLSLRKLMVMAYDENYTAELKTKEGLSVAGTTAAQRGTNKAEARSEKEVPKRICAVFVINEGLRFDSEDSKKLFQEMLSTEYADIIKNKQVPPDFLEPMTFESSRFTLGRWFALTKKRAEFNRSARVQGSTLKPEASLTVVFFDCDIFLPAGNISSLNADRVSIGYMRNWALDVEIGHKNKIFMVTRHLSQIHESLRGGFSKVSTILVPKPTLEDRQAYSENFCRNLAHKCAHLKTAGDPLKINGKTIDGVEFASGFDHKDLAIQSSGMSRNQIEKAFNECLNRGIPIDDRQIRMVKQRCMEEEYDGIVEFVHPVHGFDQVGGHDELKKYFIQKIANPLRSGDARTCSGGVLLTGPGGTGKTFIAKAAAFGAGVNFVELKLGKLMNKYIGGTEERTETMFEAIRAAAPCIAFIDEIDIALPGRQSGGDSGVGSRLASSMYTFLCDESRLGRIVVVAATNRPDLIDPVVIRSGRLGDVLPVLPPPKEGEASFQGRASILKALASKHKITFHKELQSSMADSQVGLGRLLLDDTQIWTGAEIEAVLKDAIGLAVEANRDKTVISMEDWTLAMDSIIPTTGMLEDMTDLALAYSNNVRYCPAVYQAQMKNKSALTVSLTAKGYRVP